MDDERVYNGTEDEEEHVEVGSDETLSDEAFIEEVSLLLPDSGEEEWRNGLGEGDGVGLSCEAMPADQPASKYESPLSMEYLGHVHVQMPRMPVFRNNLMVASGRFDLLMVANMAEIHVFEYNPVTGVPYDKPSLVVNTRPGETTAAMVQGANWPVDPHGINYIRLKQIRQREVLLAAGDNGRTYLFYVQELFTEVRRKNSERARNPGPDPLDVRSPIEPFLWVSVNSSVWGVDIEPNHDLLAVSNNSHNAVVFFLGPFLDGRVANPALIKRIVSPKLDHNIPDVEFVEIEDRYKKPHTFYLSCIAISGEVALWEFSYDDTANSPHTDEEQTPSSPRRSRPRGSGGVPPESLTDSEPESEPESSAMGLESESDEQEPHQGYEMRPFEGGMWWYKEDLRQDGWCIKGVCEQDFKVVSSLYEATGNQWLNEDAIFKYFNKESIRILKGDDDNTSTIQPGVRFSNYDIETKFAQALRHSPWSTVAQDRHYTLPICQKRDIKKTRYLKERKNDPEKLLSPPFNNSFFICTTKRSLYLCRVEDLYCNGARGNVFSWETPAGSNEGHFDRLSILLVVPALSAVVVASQVGVVSVFRLTRYRGVFCMRQEYCFPRAERRAFADIGSQIIAGVSISPIRHSQPGELPEFEPQEPDEHYEHQTRFRLSIIHLDNTISTYELSRPKPSEDQLEDLVL
ncbi:hypothetical protein TRICI_006384 [Trichomonascus ciferrii]|uniref:Uncharacterized protein n=1 Tax=Trichomonascus ciferrii TaxID=44093 RepID=A0A642UHN4_9ASCO|nr:hypothetical protein TRICI_006384 [Trichomonascus ciferrii]